MLTGTVAEYSGDYCFVALADGREVLVRTRGRLQITLRERSRRAEEQRQREKLTAQSLTVGDRVTMDEPQPGDYVIADVLERETWLLRKTVLSRLPNCVVANADQLAVVVAPNPGIRLGVIDRYLLAALQGGLRGLLVVNKIDLDPALPANADVLAYRARGYPVFFTQALSGAGLDVLEHELHGCFTTFCGHSGVGKSTILSRLTGVEIKTLDVKQRSLKGRSTTTSARLYRLPGGGEVMDTPGIREFGLVHLSWLDVQEYFSDIAELAQQCSFRDCAHGGEPSCAVRSAMDRGELSPARLESYRKLRAEAEAYKYWA